MESAEEAPAPAPEPAACAAEPSSEPTPVEDKTASPPPPAAAAPAKSPSPAAKAPAKASSPVSVARASSPAALRTKPRASSVSPYVSTAAKPDKFDVLDLPRSRHMYSHLTSTQAIAEQHKWNARSLVRKQEDLLHTLSRIRANLERADIEFENALKVAGTPVHKESDPTGLRKVARAAARERREMDRREGSRERRLSQSEEREAIACSDGGGIIETMSEPVDDGEKYACDEIGKLRSKIDSLLAKTSYESSYTPAGGAMDKLGGSASYLPRYTSVPPLPRASYEVEYGLGGLGGSVGGGWDVSAKNQYLSSYDPYTPLGSGFLEDFGGPPLASDI